MNDNLRTLRLRIAARVRELRKERHWTQVQLARLLDISQNHLSVLEHGNGSFTAEQLLAMLGRFNVPIDRFSPRGSPIEGQLQNALARQGAGHLLERTDILPSERLREAADSIRETLLSADSSRQITALAPVFVAHARNLNLAKIKAQLSEAGVGRRLAWAVENTKEALQVELRRADLPRRTAVSYEQARLVLDGAAVLWRQQEPSKDLPEDILDPDIASEKSKVETRARSSEPSKRWRILSRIQVDDFALALRASYE